MLKLKSQSILGIDASTSSVAFCLIEGNKPIKWGKINLVGNDIYEKIYNAKTIITLLKIHQILI